MRRWLVRATLWLLALSAALVFATVLLLRSDLAREQLRRQVAERVGEACGRSVEVGAAQFSLLPPVLVLRDVTVAGRTPEDPPFARVERLRLEARILDLWRGSWSLRQAEALRPRIHLEVAADGTNNVPRWRRGGGDRPLQLDALIVEGGEVVFNQLKLPLDFGAEDLRMRLIGDEGGSLRGQLTAREVGLALPRGPRLPLALTLHVRLLSDELILESAHLEGEQFQADVSGEVAWGALRRGESALVSAEEPPPRVRARFSIEATGEAALFERLGYLDDIAGPLLTSGDLAWDHDAWRYEGRASSPELGLLGQRLTDVRAAVSADSSRLRIEVEDGRYLQGALAGWVTSDFVTPGRPLEIDLNVSGGDLEQVLEQLGLPPLGLAGRVHGEMTLRADLPDRRRGNGWGHFTVEAATGEGLPVAGEVPLTLERGVVGSQAILLFSESQRLEASGNFDTVSREGRFEWKVDSESLAELNRLLRSALDMEEGAIWLPESGQGTLDGELRLSPGGPSYDVGMDLLRVRSGSVEARRLWGSLRADRSSVRDLKLQLAQGEGALLATGSVLFGEALEESAPAGAVPAGVALTFDAVKWPLDKLPIWLDFDLPLDGDVSGRLTLTGPPEDLRGDLEAQVAPARILDRDMGGLETRLAWSRDRFEIEDLRLSTEAGAIELRGSYESLGGAMDILVEAPGLRLEAEPLGSLFGGRLGGSLGLSASLRGDREAPRVEAVLHSDGGRILGRAPGSSERASELNLRWDGESLQAWGDWLGLLEVEGGGSLNEEAFDLDFEVKGGDLRSLAEAAVGEPLPDLSGSFAGRAVVRGFPVELGAADWALEVREVQATYHGQPVEELSPVRVRGRGDELVVESLYLGKPATEDELFVAGTVGLSPPFPLDLRLQSSLSTDWAGIVWPEIEMPGTLDLLARVRGSFEKPTFDGQGELRLGSFPVPFAPQSVDEARAIFLFYPDQLVLERLDFSFGGGRVEAWGDMGLDERLRPTGYGLYAHAEGVKALFPEGWLQRGEAELWLSSTERGRLVRGHVNLEEMRFLQEFDVGLTQALQKLLQPERIEVGSTDQWLTGTELNIDIRGPEALRVRNEVADLRGAIDLGLRGNLARPVLLGKVELEPGGKLVYADNEYEVQRGFLTFTNPYRVEPEVDLAARARLRNYEVSLNATGTPERLDINVASDPPLPELDVWELVASGRTPDREARPTRPGSTDTGRLDAQVLLYGQAASAITERVNTLFGFDKFRIDPLAESGESVSGVRFTVGKRLSKDWFVTYSRDPSTTEGDILEAEWQLNPRLVLVFTQNGDGSFAVDALWDRQFLWPARASFDAGGCAERATGSASALLAWAWAWAWVWVLVWVWAARSKSEPSKMSLNAKISGNPKTSVGPRQTAPSGSRLRPGFRSSRSRSSRFGASRSVATFRRPRFPACAPY